MFGGVEESAIDEERARRTVDRKKGGQMDAIALTWVLGRPGVISVIFGARTPEHLGENVRAIALGGTGTKPYPHWH
ncbi:aldo/keto reductase [Methylorubrum thiocyanatum]|uniref:aldo/keto reductase n=1 Tax=Methylorubrum thiocyanatum TaxID=47958 RepID=UPI00364FBAA6